MLMFNCFNIPRKSPPLQLTPLFRSKSPAETHDGFFSWVATA